jgi:hypothetical protein
MRSRRAAALAWACGSVLVVAACSSTPTLRSTDVQEAIATGLGDQVGGAFAVTCPTAVAAREGVAFTCTAVDPADGAVITIAVVQTDDEGRFEWAVTPGAPTTPAPG